MHTGRAGEHWKGKSLQEYALLYTGSNWSVGIASRTMFYSNASIEKQLQDESTGGFQGKKLPEGAAKKNRQVASTKFICDKKKLKNEDS